MKIATVIPAYNNERHIAEVVWKSKIFSNKVIVVDDGSTDNTFKVVRRYQVKVIQHGCNKGVLCATKTGIDEALKYNPDIIITLDGDGQHSPEYIPTFVSKIKTGYDLVYGKRDLSNYPFNRKIGNLGLTFLAGLLCPTGIKDSECGYRAFTRKFAEKLELDCQPKPGGYEREMNFVYECWRLKARIGFVNIRVREYHPKGAVIRGFKNFYWLLKRRLK